MKKGFLKLSLSLCLFNMIALTSCSTLLTPTSTSSQNTNDDGALVAYVKPGSGATVKPVATVAPSVTSEEMSAITTTGGTTSSVTTTGGTSSEPSYVKRGSGASIISSSGDMVYGAPSMDSESKSSESLATGAMLDSYTSVTTNTSVVKETYQKISAGDVDDNLKFDEYLTFLTKNSNLRDKEDVLKVDVSDRYIISVVDENGKSISDSSVEISSGGEVIFKGKTYANGKTLFFPKSIKNALDCQQQDCTTGTFTVTVKKGDQKVSKEMSIGENKNWEFKLPIQRENIQTPNLDICFLIDSTGSMSDEISRIQKTLGDIVSRINSLDVKPSLRYSLVTYRDRTDEYIVKRYDFTNNLTKFQEALNTLSAGGGGDYKESLNEGLYNAVQGVTWNTQDAVRLVFLVADAPAHLDYSDDYKYTDEMVKAAEKGVKIYPVSASGLDSTGEYIFRQLALFTYSKFLFITYGGDSQTPGSTVHDVGKFQENNLDDIIVNIVKDELNYLK